MKRSGHAGKIDDGDTIDEAIAWTDSIAPGAPFLAYVNLQSSHTPYVRPETFAPPFGSGHVSFRIVFGKYPADSAAAVRDLYDNSLAYADAQLGRLITSLKHDGRWDSTVMVVLGDHGEAFYEHGLGAHGGPLFHEVTHIPLVIRVPGGAAHRDILPAAAIDVAPTILGLLGLPRHPAFQGVDLADVTSRLNRPIFTLSQSGLATEVAVEQDGWKMRYNLRTAELQLFDESHDPLEQKDVGDAYPVQRHALMVSLGIWWSSQLNYYRSLPAVQSFYAPVMPHRSPLVQP
jgi:arylsulfatase A-like enzyme